MALNERLMKMVSQSKSRYTGMASKAIKPKEGRNTYRIINPETADWVVNAGGQFWADLGVHWIKSDLSVNKPVAVVGDCDVVYQKPSLLNSAIEMAIQGAHDEASKELYESWKSRKTVLINVIDRGDASNTDPQILELTSTTFGKVLDTIQMYAEHGKDITDLNDGVDIVITRTGKGLNTNYDVAISPGVSKPVSKEVAAKAHDLPKHIADNFFRGEEQKALNAIAEISGITLPRLGGPAAAGAVRTPTPALTSGSAVVEGATVEDSAPAVAQVEAPKPAAPAEDPLAARRAEILKRQQEAQAAAAAELAALEAANDTAPVGSAAPSVSEQDAILAELDALV